MGLLSWRCQPVMRRIFLSSTLSLAFLCVITTANCNLRFDVQVLHLCRCDTWSPEPPLGFFGVVEHVLIYLRINIDTCSLGAVNIMNIILCSVYKVMTILEHLFRDYQKKKIIIEMNKIKRKWCLIKFEWINCSSRSNRKFI